ncbi:MAG: L,D-transpeptidase family protein [Candidatus Methylacidiphilales bacterium]
MTHSRCLILSIYLVLCTAYASTLTAEPMRKMHSSKRESSTKQPSRYSVKELVDPQGNPLPKPFWNNPAPVGTPHVEVTLSEQVARVYFDGVLVGQSPISSGRPGNETPTGEFTVINKNRSHYSNLYGSWIDAEGKFAGEASAGRKAPAGLRYAPAPMPFFIRLTDSGVGFHQGFIPGYPASRGCIRLPKETAETFFDHLPLKTRVLINP